MGFSDAARSDRGHGAPASAAGVEGPAAGAEGGQAVLDFDEVRAVADAVLFEGYSLYPYRSSAPKNRLRWQFGVLGPSELLARGRARAADLTEPSFMETQCLVEAFPPTAGPNPAGDRLPAGGPVLTGRLRFLRLRRRQVLAVRPDGSGLEPVEQIEVDGALKVSWDEGELVEVELGTIELRAGAPPATVAFELSGVVRLEPLVRADGREVGRIDRVLSPLGGRITVSAEVAAARCLRVAVRVDNLTTPAEPIGSREEGLAVSLIGAHLVLGVRHGAFVSLLDPPAWAEEAARACRSQRAYPVLAGPEGSRDRVLASPIILYDHPRVAPESPGDFFDACEIDELLALRTRLLTDDEKRQARATDPRVAALLDRVERLTPSALLRLHGAVRERSCSPDARGRRQVPDDEHWATAVVKGTVVGSGSRILLRPGARRTDAQDLFLDGLAATVVKVMRDVEGQPCLAVTIDDDPAAELHRWYGRYHYFRLDEIEPLGCAPPKAGGGPPAKDLP